MGRFLAGAKLCSLVFVLLAASLLFIVGYTAVTRTKHFQTQSIRIQGQSRLQQKEILNQAGIKPGDNLLAVNLRLVRKRLLAHPWIAAAQVAREIPETIRIVIAEHNPLAVVDLGRKFLINQNGRIFKEYGPDDPRDLPTVTGVAYADISLGDDTLTPAMKAVVEVLQMSKSKKSAIPYAQIRGVHLDTEMGITLRVWKDERRIKLGLSRFDDKYKRLKRLLPHLRYNRKWRGFHTIDVNNPDRIVVQL